MSRVWRLRSICRERGRRHLGPGRAWRVGVRGVVRPLRAAARRRFALWAKVRGRAESRCLALRDPGCRKTLERSSCMAEAVTRRIACRVGHKPRMSEDSDGGGGNVKGADSCQTETGLTAVLLWSRTQRFSLSMRISAIGV